MRKYHYGTMPSMLLITTCGVSSLLRTPPVLVNERYIYSQNQASMEETKIGVPPAE